MGTRPTASKALRPGAAARSATTSVPTNLPAQLVPLIINQDNYLPGRHPEEGPEQLGPARRRRLQPERQDGRSRPASASTTTTSISTSCSSRGWCRRSTGSTRCSRRATDLQLQRRQAVPGPERHPAVPGAVLDGSEQPHRLHGAVECQRAAHPSRGNYLVRGGLHRQPQLQRAQALQHQPGAARDDADRDARAVPGIPVGDPLLVRCGLGRASTACRSASRSAIRTGCSSSATTSSRRAATTARARSRRTTPRSPGT